MTVARLIQPGSGKVLEVAEESADFWRSLGYRDEAPAPAPAKEPAPAKKAAAPRKRAAASPKKP